MTVHRLELVARTDVGRVRTHNEDYMLTNAELGLVVLCDGMGGHNAGEIASRIAAEQVMTDLVPAQRDDGADDLESLMRVGQSVEHANRSLFQAMAQNQEYQGMGTTLVVGMFREGHMYIAHVGDSRIYRLRDDKFEQLTRDHTLVQRLVDDKVFSSIIEAKNAGIGDNVLVRGLGIEHNVEVDVGDMELEPGDTFLFCSDGLSGFVQDAEIARVMKEEALALTDQAEVLIEVALQRGGLDNISLVLARPKL